MKTLRQTSLILTTLALLATVAMAQPGAGRMQRGQGDGPGDCEFGPRAEQRLERMKDHLKLTDEQVEAIEAIEDQAMTDTRELRKELARLRNQKQGEMLKDEPSLKALTGIIEQMGELRTRIQVNRVKTRLAIREQLTEEQRDKMMMLGRHQGPGNRGPRDGHGRRGGRGFGREF